MNTRNIFIICFENLQYFNSYYQNLIEFLLKYNRVQVATIYFKNSRVRIKLILKLKTYIKKFL